jgi:hypothetical protein
MNPPTHQVLFIGKEFELLEVGNYIVTSEDEAANCRWRRKFKCNDLAMPMTDGARFTEAWRIPAPPVKPPQYRFKTVCRILSIEINNGPKAFAKKVILAARHLALRVQVFARPADIGEAHTCPYEVIETDQGNFQIYGVSTTLCFIFTSAKRAIQFMICSHRASDLWWRCAGSGGSDVCCDTQHCLQLD